MILKPDRTIELSAYGKEQLDENKDKKELTMYAVTSNNIVTKIVSCPTQNKPDNSIEYPDEAQIHVGCDVRFFSSAGIRLIVAEAMAANLITLGTNQIAVWENGKYVVKHDYTNAQVWEKATGNLRELALGENLDPTLTTVKPSDSEAVWQSGRWVVPNTVKARGRGKNEISCSR